METSHDVRNIFLTINLYINLFVVSTFVFTNAYGSRITEDYPEAVVLPINSDDVREAVLLGLELDRGSSHAHSLEHSTSPSSSSNTAWFGPRLGRRKRSVVLDDDLIETLDDGNRKNSNNVEDDAQIFRHFSSRIPVIIHGYISKRHLMKPRLGRGGNAWSESDDDRAMKGPPFSPRLGRRSMPMKPRLGRAGSAENAVFKPRLGRDPNFGGNEFVDYNTVAILDDKDH